MNQALGSLVHAPQPYMLPSGLLTLYVFWSPIAPTPAVIPATKNLFLSFLFLFNA